MPSLASSAVAGVPRPATPADGSEPGQPYRRTASSPSSDQSSWSMAKLMIRGVSARWGGSDCCASLKCCDWTCAAPASPSRNASTRTYSLGSSRLRDQSNHRQPGSARVARVNSPAISGQRSASSGRIRNLAVMKIIRALLQRGRSSMISHRPPRAPAWPRGGARCRCMAPCTGRRDVHMAAWPSGWSGTVGAMATMVSFHAHPDDECIACGGVIRKASEEGHRVVLVVATRGERGEVPDGFLADGEEIWQRRVAETHASAEILGAQRVEFLGYTDSGMMGTPANGAPGSFWSTPVDEAAKKLAAILDEERAVVLTCYDEHGGYGHPDHIQVHRVGMCAAALAGTPRVYQNTMNRDHMERGRAAYAEQAAAAGVEMDDLDDSDDWGKPESVITAAVDVTPYLEHKRRAMRAHASQISEASFFLALPEEAFRYGFGTEWFIRDGQGPGITETDLMAGL